MTDPIDALIAALDDPTRRALYRYVAGSDHEVSRDEAAGAAGVSRSAAAFHLDKLVEAGVLIPSFRRLNDRSGPGAGRPAKLYRSSRSAIELSIPPRRYLIAGEILTAALQAISPATAEEAVRAAAVERGRLVAEELRQDGLAAPRLTSALSLLGFDPEVARGGDISLGNCPFHALAELSIERTCSMNQAFVSGILEGLADTRHVATLDPGPGRCCVRITGRR